MSVAGAVRSGVRVGVDVGSVRVGVAACDPGGVLASPVATLQRRPRTDADVAELAALVAEREAIEVVVGLPRSLRGGSGTAVAVATDYARRVAAAVAPVPVRMVDERLSTVEAQRALHAAGRSVRSSRQDIDAAAAAVILQHALDTERATGAAPGRIVTVDE
jgi:putative Holliday junction resolvase